MAAGNWQLTNEGLTKLTNGEWLDGDTYKIALFLSTSNIGPSSTTYAGLSNEHANGNGYTTGGESTTVSRSGTTSLTITATNVTWSASPGSITARYAVLYEVGGRVLAYCLLNAAGGGTDVTVTAGNDLELAINAASGVMLFIAG